MANLKDVIYLSAEDYNTLYTNGTVTINGTTLTYDANNLYIVPDDTDTKISTALANYIAKSNTTGLVKNDGTIDTNTYALSSALSDYIAKSNTAGLVKNDGTIDTSTYLTSIPLTLSPQTTGFKISGGTTSKTLTVGGDYTLGAACAKSVTDNSSSAAVTSSDTNLITGRTLYYHCANKGFLTELSKGTTTGSGNAVTDLSISGNTITLSKGTTFLNKLGILTLNWYQSTTCTYTAIIGGSITFTKNNSVASTSASVHLAFTMINNSGYNGTCSISSQTQTSVTMSGTPSGATLLVIGY